MDSTTETGATPPKDGKRAWARAGAFGAAGLLAGGLLAGSLSASADDSGSTTSEGTGSNGTTAPAQPGGTRDQSRPQRSDEELLTGSTADKVEAAALEEYPGATVVRIESDSDGVDEAHLMTADGEPVTVEVGKDFSVSGTEESGGPGHGGPGGPGGPAGVPGSDGSSEGGST
ncbi:MAG TPA: hypothetical protein VF227_03800, partial [Actinomycetes bacterium]